MPKIPTDLLVQLEAALPKELVAQFKAMNQKQDFNMITDAKVKSLVDVQGQSVDVIAIAKQLQEEADREAALRKQKTMREQAQLDASASSIRSQAASMASPWMPSIPKRYSGGR